MGSVASLWGAHAGASLVLALSEMQSRDYLVVSTNFPEDEEESKSTNDAGFVYKESVIKELLSLSDKKANSKLEGLKKEITGGQRLNELCDLLKHSGGECGNWPTGKAQIQLRDFLGNASTSNITKNQISEFAVAVGIVSNKGEWNRITKYK